jgi:hypothetical protein
MQTTQGAPGALLECYKNVPSQSSGTLDCLTEASKSSTKCLKKRLQEGPGFLTTNQPPDLAALSRNSPTAHYFCTRLHVSSLKICVWLKSVDARPLWGPPRKTVSSHKLLHNPYSWGSNKSQHYSCVCPSHD